MANIKNNFSRYSIALKNRFNHGNKNKKFDSLLYFIIKGGGCIEPGKRC